MSSSPWFVIVMLGFVIAGYAWMMPKTSASRGNEGFVSEEAYTQLLEDLEAENRELVDAVAKFKEDQDETVNRLSRRIVDMERQMKNWTEQAMQAPAVVLAKSPAPEASEPSSSPAGYESEPEYRLAKSSTANNDVANDEPPVVEQSMEITPTTLRDRYSELFALHDKGRSVEQIARTMGLNKGEVQLILQLARREEQHHA